MLKKIMVALIACQLALPARAEPPQTKPTPHFCKADFGLGLIIGAALTIGVGVIFARLGLHKLEDALEKAKKDQKEKGCS